MLKHLAFLLIGSSSLYASNYKQDLDRLTHNTNYTRSLKDIGEVAADAFEGKDKRTIDEIIYILSCGKSLGFNKSLKVFSGIGPDGTYTDYSIATWIMDNAYKVSKDSFKYINYYGANADFVSTYYKALCLLDYKVDDKPKYIKTKEEIEKEETDKAVNKILDSIDSGEMSINDLIEKGKAETNGNETLLSGWNLAHYAINKKYDIKKKENESIGSVMDKWDVTPGNQCLTRQSILQFNQYFGSKDKVDESEKYNILSIVKIMRDYTGLPDFDQLKLNDKEFVNENQKALLDSFNNIDRWKSKMLQLKNKKAILDEFNKLFGQVFAFDSFHHDSYYDWFFDSQKVECLVESFDEFKSYINNDEIIKFSSLNFEEETFRKLLKTNSIDITGLSENVKNRFFKEVECLEKNASIPWYILKMLCCFIDKGVENKESLLHIADICIEKIKIQIIGSYPCYRRIGMYFSPILCSIINQHVFKPDELRKRFEEIKNDIDIDLAKAFLSQKNDAGFYVFSDKEIMDFRGANNHDIRSAANEEIRNNRQWLRDLLPDENQRGHTVNYATANETIGAVDYLGGIEAIDSIYRDKINGLKQDECENTIFEKLNKLADTDKKNKIKTELERKEIKEHYRHIVAVLEDNADNWDWFFKKMYDCSIANGINSNSCRPLAFMIQGLSKSMPSLNFYLQKGYDSAALEQVKNRKYNTEEDEAKLKESIRINKIITNMFFNKQFMVDLATKHKTKEKIDEELIKQFKKESKMDPDKEQLDRIKSISSFYIDFIKDEKNLSKLSKQSQAYRELKGKICEKMSLLSFALSSNEERKQAFESMEGDIIAYVKNEMSESNLVIPEVLSAHNRIDVIPNYIRQIFINLGIPENECGESNNTHIIKIGEKTTLSDAIEALARKIDITEEETHYAQILEESKKKSTTKEQLKTIANYLGLTGYDDKLEEFKNLKKNEDPKINIENTKEREAVLDMIKTFNKIASKL